MPNRPTPTAPARKVSTHGPGVDLANNPSATHIPARSTSLLAQAQSQSARPTPPQTAPPIPLAPQPLAASASAATGSAQGTVATPRSTPPAGTYTTAQKVALSTTTVGASIRYTTNGSAPSETAGTLYTGPISVSSTTTIKAIAYANGMTDSSVATGLYTINLPQVAAPVFTPSQGTYTSVQAVSLTSITSGAKIRYTTDGSAPSETAGTAYDKPITVGASTTIKAIAYKNNGMTDSPVNTAAYTINLAPPFSLTLSQRSANLLQGGSAPIQISASRGKDFKDPITLSLGTLPAGVTGQLSRTSLSTSSPAILTLTARHDATVGNFSVTITGTSGSLQDTETISVAVQKVNYSLFAQPPVQVVLAGKTTTFDVYVGSPGAVNPPFALSVTGLPAGVTAAFQPATLSGAGHSVLTLTTQSTAASGQHPFTVKATSGSTVVQAALTVSVRTPDFSLTSNFSAQATKAGRGVSQRITVAAANGFKGKVDFKVTGLPTGTTATFTPPSVIGSGTTVLNISTSASTPSGRSALAITGTNSGTPSSVANSTSTRSDGLAPRDITGGTITHTIPADFTVGNPDFDLQAPAQAQIVAPGETAEYEIDMTPENGFTGIVNLTATGLPPGVTATFTNNFLTLPATTILQLTSTSTAAPATYVPTINATSSGLTHAIPITLVLSTDPDFEVYPSPKTGLLLLGGSITYAINVAPFNGFSGAVNLSVTGMPSGMTASLSPPTINTAGNTTLTVSDASAAPGTYQLAGCGKSQICLGGSDIPI